MASCKNDFLCTLKPLACEYSQHSAMSPLVSLQNYIWRTRAEIPHWWQISFHGRSSGSIMISGFKTTKCWEPPLVSDYDLGREPTTNSTHMWQVPSPILYHCTGPFFFVIIIIKFIYLFPPKTIMSHRFFYVESLVVWLSSAYHLQLVTTNLWYFLFPFFSATKERMSTNLRYTCSNDGSTVNHWTFFTNK